LRKGITGYGARKNIVEKFTPEFREFENFFPSFIKISTISILTFSRSFVVFCRFSIIWLRFFETRAVPRYKIVDPGEGPNPRHITAGQGFRDLTL
jgi:hypothetical protein